MYQDVAHCYRGRGWLTLRMCNQCVHSSVQQNNFNIFFILVPYVKALPQYLPFLTLVTVDETAKASSGESYTRQLYKNKKGSVEGNEHMGTDQISSL